MAVLRNANVDHHVSQVANVALTMDVAKLETAARQALQLVVVVLHASVDHHASQVANVASTMDAARLENAAKPPLKLHVDAVHASVDLPVSQVALAALAMDAATLLPESESPPHASKPCPTIMASRRLSSQTSRVSIFIRLSSLGKYVVLFFYPLDFTFVCPTEIVQFSDMAK